MQGCLGFFLAVAFLALTSCASNIPITIQKPPPGNPAVELVRSDVSKFVGSQVRWGGTIASVENRQNHTLIEIVARELRSNGRPNENDRSAGRFIAQIEGFLEPAIYEKGRLLTVNGTIADQTTRTIGEFTYTFPVVIADDYFLWQPLLPPPRYNQVPFYYDPWYTYPYPYPLRLHPFFW